MEGEKRLSLATYDKKAEDNVVKGDYALPFCSLFLITYVRKCDVFECDPSHTLLVFLYMLA